MNRLRILTVTTMVLLCVGIALPAGTARAQQKSLKDQLLGTWTLVSVTDVYQDGRQENAWGPAVKGTVSFDGNSHFTFIIIGADLPNPSAKPPQESKRLVVAQFGTYAVDEAAKTVTYTYERSTNPNWDGTARKASVTVDGDEFKQASAPIETPQGTFTPTLVFKRTK
jgi:hypothetical protein